jgi:hypothetical protein
MKNRIFGIFLLLACIVPVSFTTVWLKLERADIQEEALAKMQALSDETELTQIRIHRTETQQLRWKDRHEFLYQGEMYDVVRKETRGDYTVYFCFRDSKETQLERRAENFWKQVYGSDDEGAQGEVQLIYLWHHLAMPSSFAYFIPKEVRTPSFFIYSHAQFRVDLRIDVPPPRVS